MARKASIFAAALVGVLAAGQPARAGEFAPLSWLFSTDNGGPLAPAVTPDRPYWHGDAAVPPAMRWHDRDIEIVDEYGFNIGTRLPPPETVVPLSVEATLSADAGAVLAPRPAPRRRHRRTGVARAVCPPSAVRPAAAAALGVTAPPDPPWTPARAER